MKRIFTLLIGVIIAISIVNSQNSPAPPQAFSYVATIVKNGAVVANKTVYLRVSILRNSASGSPDYIEKFTTVTNSSGQVNIEIGRGTPQNGDFAGIDWSADKYFLKVEVDTKGNSAYNDVSNTQLLSVPYALYAGQAASAPNFIESDPVFSNSVAHNISSGDISDWNSAFSWQDHHGLYKPNSYVPSWSELTNNPFGFTNPADNQLIKYNNTNGLWENWTPNFLYSYAETDPIWSGVSGNYYTKNNLLTSGQAQINWDNLINLNSAVIDLTDGSLSGNLVGSGIDAGNITTGILPLDRLSGISTTQLSATAGITNGQLVSIEASKVTGINDGYTPRSTGGSLVAGSLKDNGYIVQIGDMNAGLGFSATGYIGYRFTAKASNIGNPWTGSTGFIGLCSNGYTDNTGIIGEGSGSTSSTGVNGYGHNASGDNRGVYAQAEYGTNAYGLYATASGGTTNWAGYFNNGNVYIKGQIQSPYLTSESGTTLVLDASGWIKKLSSDRSLKENITPLSSSLAKVLQLQGVNFTWKSDDDHMLDIGFIAQDVQKVLPELVIKDKNDGLLSIKYQNMVAVLVEAIKEQQKQIDELKQLVKSLKEK